MITQSITREEVIQLAQTMPAEKLGRWYEYGLFVLSQPLVIPALDEAHQELHLAEDTIAWEAASDEDWLKMEQLIARER